MNGPYGGFDPGLKVDGVRNARSNRLHGGTGQPGRGPQQSSLLAGRGGRDGLLYENGHDTRGNPSSFHSPGGSLYGVPPPVRSISPDSLGNGSDSDPLNGPSPQLTTTKAPTKSVPGAFSSPPPGAYSNSSPGAFSSTHDAISHKIAAFDNASVASRQAARIEIAPGMMARLRGADETWAAVENDYYIPTQCFCCQLDICCIMDANFVLCPQCKVVSPLEGCAQPGFDGGVGLGFTFDDLQKWQGEIIHRRGRQQQQQLEQQTHLPLGW